MSISVQLPFYTSTEDEKKALLLSLERRAGSPSSTKHIGLVDWIIECAWPYIQLARINGLVGVWLTFWPCTWGVTMAAYNSRSPATVLTNTIPLLWLGCALLHSAACTINDIFDREVDRLVERTKHRPIASGRISVFSAIVFLFLQVGAFLALLTLAPKICALLALANLPVQFIYPLFKRVTSLTSFFLGLTFSWGSLVGWSAVTGSVDWSVVLPLYVAGVCWAMGYDTIYAHQDKKDDPKAGVKSTALLFGSYSRPILSLLATAFIAAFALAGIRNNQGLPFFLFAVGVAAAHVTWQLATVDFDKPESCWEKFYSNSWIGWPLWFGLLVDYYVHIAV